MNCVVSPVRSADQVFRIQDVKIAVRNVSNRDWIHVMNDDLVENLVTLYSEIPTVITSDDFPTGLLPLNGSVERLIQPPLKAERVCSDNGLNLKVIVSLLESVDLT